MIRNVHERPGHATPEYHTLTIPSPTAYGGLSPDVLSGTIAEFAVCSSATKPQDIILRPITPEPDLAQSFARPKDLWPRQHATPDLRQVFFGFGITPNPQA